MDKILIVKPRDSVASVHPAVVDGTVVSQSKTVITETVILPDHIVKLCVSIASYSVDMRGGFINIDSRPIHIVVRAGDLVVIVTYDIIGNGVSRHSDRCGTDYHYNGNDNRKHL